VLVIVYDIIFQQWDCGGRCCPISHPELVPVIEAANVLHHIVGRSVEVTAEDDRTVEPPDLLCDPIEHLARVRVPVR
jgi:hypothetical protein